MRRKPISRAGDPPGGQAARAQAIPRPSPTRERGTGTRALAGHYTEDGSWRAVWIHYDGYPSGLGADLVRAAALHGGDPAPVLEHLFSSKGWSSWPKSPHHPEDPDDVIFTPANVYYDFHWFYLFDRNARRLDVIPADKQMIPKTRISFGADGQPDQPLGESTLTLRDLKPAWDAWRRTCPAPLAALLDELLALLGVREKRVGITDPLDNPALHALATNHHVICHGEGFTARGTLFLEGGEIPLPDFFTFWPAHEPLWQRLQSELGLVVAIEQGALYRELAVVETVTQPRLQLSLADALEKHPDSGLELGDHLLENLHTFSTPAWKWLFTEAWRRAGEL